MRALLVVMLTAAAFLAGCRHLAPPKGEEIAQPSLDPAAMEPDENFPVLTPAPGSADAAQEPPASDAPTYGDEIELEALFVIDPVAGSKRLQPESLVLASGETWIVAYRPIRSHFPYADRRVVVRGRQYWNPSHVQSVVATHFELQSIELAPGETPHDPPPSELPAPPLIRTLPELEARLGRGLWVHCAGVLESLRDGEEETPWLAGTFRLEDGTGLPLRGISNQSQRFTELAGKKSTILARITGGDQGSPIRLAPATICPGVVDRCGMTLDNTRDL